MIEKILEWGGRIFAVIGIICLFWEAVACLRRRSNPKLTIVGIVFLAVSVIGYAITELILRNQDVPAIFAVVWIAFLWAYLICNIISECILYRKNRAVKKAERQNDALVAAASADENEETQSEEENPTDTDKTE